jgi:hypothetical protein
MKEVMWHIEQFRKPVGVDSSDTSVLLWHSRSYLSTYSQYDHQNQRRIHSISTTVNMFLAK